MRGRATVFMVLAMGTGLLAQSQQPSPNADPVEIARWILQQGGLVTAIALLLYFWRRDMHQWRLDQVRHDAERQAWQDRLMDERKTELEERKHETDLLLNVIRENSGALARTSEALAMLTMRRHES